MVLAKLLCRPGRSRKEAESESLVADRSTKAKSLDPNSQEVLDKQKSWLAAEKQELEAHEKAAAVEHDFETKFQNLIAARRAGKRALRRRGNSSLTEQVDAETEEVPDDMVSKSELQAILKEMDIDFEEPELFEKVYHLFDADGDGVVNQEEFSVVMVFLMCRGTAHNKTEVAYRLFDTNRDGHISKREFNDMIASIMGNRLDSLVRVERGLEVLDAYLKSEYASELLDFLADTNYLHELQTLEKRQEMMAISTAKNLYSNFLAQDAERQINVSNSVREACRAAIFDCQDEFLPVSIFLDCEKEVVALIQDGPLFRLRKKLRESHQYFADAAWVEYGIGEGEDEGMTYEMFADWSEKTPNLFAFFDTIAEVLDRSEAIAAGMNEMLAAHSAPV